MTKYVIGEEDTMEISNLPGYMIYATNHWPKHAAHADPGSWDKELDEDVQESLRVFNGTSGAVAAWCRIVAKIFDIEFEEQESFGDLPSVLQDFADKAASCLVEKRNMNLAFLRDTLFIQLVACRLETSEERIIALLSLVTIFEELYKFSGRTSYLDHLIRLIQGKPFNELYSLRYVLAQALASRFRQNGNRSDIEGAISLYRDFLSFDSSSIPQADFLVDLGYDLSLYFEKTGEASYIDGVISILEGVITLAIPERAMPLNNLAYNLLARFQRTGERVDLDRAVRYSTEAIHLDASLKSGDGRLRLHTFAVVLYERYLQDGRTEDLDHAIRTLTEVVEWTPQTHVDFRMYRNDLDKMQVSKDQLLASKDRALETSPKLTPDPQRSQQLSQPLRSYTASQWQRRQNTESSTSVLGGEIFEEQATESTRSLDALMEALRAKPSDELSPSEDLLAIIKTWKENGFKEPADREDIAGSESGGGVQDAELQVFS
jgi:hypothetical protein